MEASGITKQRDFYRKLPKVELHRHLEGSIRLETLREVAQEYGVQLPIRKNLPALVQVQEEDALTFSNFLSKFQTLREFYRSTDTITRIAYEAVVDAAQDGVEYLELRFAPIALSRVQGFPLTDVMDWVIESSQQASQEFGIITRYLVTVNRHESVRMAEDVIRLATDYVNKGVVGVDLAGNEAEFSAKPFANLIKEAKLSGLSATIHAGEWAGADSVREALVDLEADRIGHGVRVLEDSDVVEIARQKQTFFEVCVTSNYQSGVVSKIEEHPIKKMHEAELGISLNTDDPSISRITLSDEYQLAVETLGFSKQTLTNCILNAAKASFLPEQERNQLVENLQKKLTALVD